ncbi:MAG TPA: hypothetical protein VHE37_08485 [Nevskiaceae bacterium]|nr:hypothetical protein [Nevskiaceae bacterium]
MSESSIDGQIIDRRLAIEVLHQAQVALPQPIRGWIAASGKFIAGEAPAAVAPWARLWSHPQAPAVPAAGELAPGVLNLVISLNTKGVLEMRAWRLVDGAPAEVVLKIRE